MKNSLNETVKASCNRSKNSYINFNSKDVSLTGNANPMYSTVNVSNLIDAIHEYQRSAECD